MDMQALNARRWWIAGPFLAGLVLMTLLEVSSVNLMSSVRAFVIGESLWSKEAKSAVIYLERYAHSRRSEDYRRFMTALAVPLGDRLARIELERAEPDLSLVRQGLLQGGNHPDDVDGMIGLYKRFRHLPDFAAAVDIWAEADVAIDELRVLGERIRLEVESGEPVRAQEQALLVRLELLNDRLTAYGKAFSARLGDISRDVRRWGMVATLAMALFLVAAGGWAIHCLMRWQQRAELVLRAVNERWSLAASAASIGVFDWDVALDRMSLDGRAAALYGLRAEDMEVESSQLTRGVVHAEDVPMLRQALREAIDRRQPLQVRYRVVHPPARLRHIELTALVSDRERRLRMVGILRDVSEDFVAQQLRLDKEAAERANRAKGAFLSRVSHELRTPLNAVLGFSQLLQLDHPHRLSALQAERVQHIVDSSHRLLELINDMLDLSTLDAGGLGVPARDVDLPLLLDGCLRQMQPLARSHQVQLLWQAPATAAMYVRADPGRLQQVFVNLLSNAIKYNRPGGTARLSCSVEGEWAVVVVSDTGLGMDGAQLAQLFQPFNRLGAEYTKVPGSGLGLVITRQLLKLMGGGLEVSSETGVGSRFEVSLPLPRTVRPQPA